MKQKTTQIDFEKKINASKIHSGITNLNRSHGKTTFSFVVRCYNEKQKLRYLLSDIMCLATDNIYYEIIVLDGGSSDGTETEAFISGCDVYKILPSDFSYDTSINFLFQKASCDYVICLSAHTRIRDMFLLYKIRDLVSLGYDVIVPRQVAGATYCDGSLYEELYLLKAYPPFLLVNQASFRYSNSAGVVKRQVWTDFNFPNLNGQEDEYWYRAVVRDGVRAFYAHNICIEHFHDWSPSDVVKRLLGLPSKGIVDVLKKILLVGPPMFFLLLIFSGNLRLSTSYALSHAKGVWKSRRGVDGN